MIQASPSRVIARYTVIEALHGRLVWALSVMLILILTVSFLIDALAIVEQSESTLSVAAPLARLMAISVVGVFVIASTSQEVDGRGLEILLAAPITRTMWITGRFLGFSVVALTTALFAGLALLPFAAPAALIAWVLSLFGELLLISGLGLLLSVSLRPATVAILALLGTYWCARTIGVIQSLQQSTPVEPLAESITGSLVSVLVDFLALILPRFDLMAQTSWLTTETSLTLWLPLPGLLQAAIYAVLVLVVGSIDMERRDV